MSNDSSFFDPSDALLANLSAPKLTRRQFSVMLGISSGFALGMSSGVNAAGAALAPSASDMNAYVHIGDSGEIIIYAPNPEVGQGVKTSLPMIVAEELDANWDSVTVKNAAVNPIKYGAQFAGGSLSVPQRWDEMRKMGAMVRQMLLAAAAQQWQLPVSQLSTADSFVNHSASGKKASYAELASVAAKQKVPAQEELQFKKTADYRLLGKRITGVDNHLIVTGSPLFGIDTTVPGMLYATFTKCRTIGGKVISDNLDEIKALPGVIDAFVMDGNVDVYKYDSSNAELSSGVAIVANNTWQAFKARRSLKIQWDTSKASTDSWTAISKEARKVALGEGTKVTLEQGDVASAFDNSNAIVESFYSTDFVSHAQLEPQNCVAHFKGDSLEVWAPTQTPSAVPGSLAGLMKMPVKDITVHQIRGGGGFGRRLSNEYVHEAALISKKMSAPVKLQWTREDDMAFDYYRVGAFYSLKGSLDKTGKLNAWSNHVIALSADGKKPNAGAGVRPLDFPAKMIKHVKTSQSLIASKTPTGFWRAPSSNTFAFAEQSFVHELAVKAGRDHLEFLIESLGEPKWLEPDNMASLNTERAINTIKQVAKNAGWGKKMPAGRALGLSFYFSHAGHIAEVADVSVDDNKKVTIHKVWVVGDVGPIVNLSGAENQVQGSVIDGISTLAAQTIGIEGGAVQQTNFHQYPMLRSSQRPKIDVKFLATDYKPTGLGEPALPPIAAAVCNAIFTISGHRIRQLPILNEGFVV